MVKIPKIIPSPQLTCFDLILSFDGMQAIPKDVTLLDNL